MPCVRVACILNASCVHLASCPNARICILCASRRIMHWTRQPFSSCSHPKSASFVWHTRLASLLPPLLAFMLFFLHCFLFSTYHVQERVKPRRKRAKRKRKRRQAQPAGCLSQLHSQSAFFSYARTHHPALWSLTRHPPSQPPSPVAQGASLPSETATQARWWQHSGLYPILSKWMCCGSWGASAYVCLFGLDCDMCVCVRLYCQSQCPCSSCTQAPPLPQQALCSGTNKGETGWW